MRAPDRTGNERVSVYHGRAVHMTEAPRKNKRDKPAYECRVNISCDQIGAVVCLPWPMSPGGAYQYIPKTREGYTPEMLDDIGRFLRKVNGWR